MYLFYLKKYIDIPGGCRLCMEVKDAKRVYVNDGQLL
jgi:hypothetical protein